MSDIRILSCPQCGFPKIRDCGNGLYQCDDCGTHFDKNENIVQTNEEWIKSMNTEQLAKKFHDNDVYAFFVCRNGGKVPSVEHYVEWLKEIHE